MICDLDPSSIIPYNVKIAKFEVRIEVNWCFTPFFNHTRLYMVVMFPQLEEHIVPGSEPATFC